ncbi:Leucine-rich repeat-containing protein 26 [Sciurus carolinensis]|uniref:Leucine-rich repeat-containing protein 26 n=1 Tax=Sciurus carolinensis TaxID=30640 RepID=A0AA41NDQ5_SCICA|nr:Leucine-rich repeat-containing protein 26 [Sciurus carolinensis]
MKSSSVFSRPPLLQSLLLLLLLPPPPLRPICAQVSTGAATSWTPGAPDCPEACACAPGGQANCSALALVAVPPGLSRWVRTLLLDHNRVRALPPGAFAGAGALLRLDLRENGLRSVHARAFWGLSVLQRLDLSDNQLEALAPGTFASLRALRSLSLADNRLALLEPAALGALPLLRALSLQDNALSALSPDLLTGLPALDALRLRGNPWACGCALRSLCAWLRQHPRPASEAETLLCVSPGRQTLSPLTAFPDAAFRHCAQPLAARDLAVVYALGPVSFLASLATCLALGSVLTACRARRRRCRASARRPPRRPPDPDPDGPASPEIPVSPTAASAQA